MQERFVSYLPLSHVAANIMDIFMATQCLGTVYFANRDALKGTLVSILKVVTETNDLQLQKQKCNIVTYHCEGGPPHCVLRCAKGVGEGAGEDDPGEEQLGVSALHIFAPVKKIAAPSIPGVLHIGTQHYAESLPPNFDSSHMRFAKLRQAPL